MKATNTTAPLATPSRSDMGGGNFAPRRVDLRAERRARFIKGVQRQINRLNKLHIEPSSQDWFELLDGDIAHAPKCNVSLRNGSKIMPLSEGKTHMCCETTFDATTFYVEVIHACRNGEFDELLAATSGKARKA